MSWLGRGKHDRDLAKEMSAHRAERVDDLIDRGVPEADARRRAALEFGNQSRYVEQSREVWIAAWLEGLWQDARYAVRALRRQPVFALSAVLVLALGIGLVSGLFLVINATVFKPWPVSDPSSIALIRARPGPNEDFGSISHPEYRYLRERTRSFTSLAVNIRGGGPIGDGTTSLTVQTNFVTANYFDTLGIHMAAGRGFLPADEDYRAPAPVAIISERMWRQMFGGDPAIIGRTIRLFDRPTQCVGVAAAGFNDVYGTTGVDAWMPLPSISLQYPRFARGFDDPKGSAGVVIGRLKSGVPREEALAELDVLSRQFKSAVPLESHGLLMTDTRPIEADRLPKGQLPVMGMLFGALMLVMLIACGNAGNLILARALARQREIAIRLSLGAGRRRVVRQLLTESLFISLAAGAVGLAVATAVPRVISATSKAGTNGAVPPGFFAPDLIVFVFVFGLSSLACLLCGLGPALHLTRARVAHAGDRHGVTRGGHRLRNALLAMQIGLTMVILTGAGLLTRAIGHAFTLDPGFAVDDVLKVTLQLPASASVATRTITARNVADGVVAAGAGDVTRVDFAPFDGSAAIRMFNYTSNGQTGARQLLTRGVSPDYFRVLGIQFVAGRPFVEDAARSEVVVSEEVARLFPDGRAIGQQLVTTTSAPAPPRGASAVAAAGTPSTESTSTTHVIVGVVKEVPVRSLEDQGRTLYWAPDVGSTLLVRTSVPTAAQRITAAVESAAPGTPVATETLRANMLRSINDIVVGSRVAWMIGLVALVLATIGAFGVFAYLVEERRREIGVRMALGARGLSVIRTVLGAASRPVLAGLAVGLSLSLAASPLLRSFLYGLSPFDPIAYIEIGGILTAAALLTTWIPAMRATRIDPATVLRND